MKILHDVKDPVFEDQYAESYYHILFYDHPELVSIEYYPEFNRFISLKHLKLDDNETPVIENLKSWSVVKDINYRKSINIYNENRVTLVPDKFFNEAQAEKLFKLNFNNTQKDQVNSFHLDPLKLHCLFSQATDAHTLSKTLPNLKLQHLSPAFLHALSAHSEADKSLIYCHVLSDSVHIGIMEHSELKFYNIFEQSSHTDILYHILNVSKQTGINPNEHNYYFSGNINNNDPLYNLLYKYIRNIFLCSKPHDLNFSPVVAQLPLHYFYPIFYIVKCV